MTLLTDFAGGEAGVMFNIFVFIISKNIHVVVYTIANAAIRLATLLAIYSSGGTTWVWAPVRETIWGPTKWWHI